MIKNDKSEIRSRPEGGQGSTVMQSYSFYLKALFLELPITFTRT